jgi:glycosyltransferase involved in cell wall biosynthesis
MTGSREPVVSVVTINYNQGQFLGDAIADVAAQSYLSWQHIIVDPGSTDGSSELYKPLRSDPRYVVIEQPDRGPADGLNKGFAAATGDIFYYLNADDRVLPHAFQSAVGLLTPRLKQPLAIAAHGRIIGEGGAAVRPVRTDALTLRGYAYGANVVVQQSTFLTREAFECAGGFNMGNKVSWDGELLIDLLMKGGRFERIDDVWGLFRIYGGSITGSQRLADVLTRENARIFEKIVGRPRCRRDILEAGVRRGLKHARYPRLALESARLRMQGLAIRELGH